MPRTPTIILGFVVALVPYLGFPRAWDTVILSALGLLIALPPIILARRDGRSSIVTPVVPLEEKREDTMPEVFVPDAITDDAQDTSAFDQPSAPLEEEDVPHGIAVAHVVPVEDAPVWESARTVHEEVASAPLVSHEEDDARSTHHLAVHSVHESSYDSAPVAKKPRAKRAPRARMPKDDGVSGV